MTYMLLPKMLSRYVIEYGPNVTYLPSLLRLYMLFSRKRGIIVNLSSISDVVPGALLATYSGTKVDASR